LEPTKILRQSISRPYSIVHPLLIGQPPNHAERLYTLKYQLKPLSFLNGMTSRLFVVNLAVLVVLCSYFPIQKVIEPENKQLWF